MFFKGSFFRWGIRAVWAGFGLCRGKRSFSYYGLGVAFRLPITAIDWPFFSLAPHHPQLSVLKRSLACLFQILLERFPQLGCTWATKLFLVPD